MITLCLHFIFLQKKNVRFTSVYKQFINIAPSDDVPTFINYVLILIHIKIFQEGDPDFLTVFNKYSHRVIIQISQSRAHLRPSSCSKRALYKYIELHMKENWSEYINT